MIMSLAIMLYENMFSAFTKYLVEYAAIYLYRFGEWFSWWSVVFCINHLVSQY